MTTSDPGRRFPIVLTLAAAALLAALFALGVWQVQRLKWKEGLLARVEAARTAPPQPLALLLSQAAKGEDLEWRTASVQCDPGPPAAQSLLYALDNGDVAWRALSRCGARFPQNRVLIDRGFVAALKGSTAPTGVVLPAPGNVTGVLRRARQPMIVRPVVAIGGAFRFQDRDARPLAEVAAPSAPADYYLVASAETPAPAGVTPAPLPVDIPNNHLGYAITWFGLAAALAAIYAAMLWRRRKG